MTTQPATGASGARFWAASWPGFVAMALVGSNVSVIAVTQYLPVLAIQSARYAVAGFAILALARVFEIRLVTPRGRDILWVVLGALVGLVGFTLATIVGTRHAEPGLLGAAVACIPVVLAIMGPLAQRRRPSPRVTGGAVIVSAGAVVVTGWGHADVIGVTMAALLIICEAGFRLLGAQALPRMGPWSYSAATSLAAAVVFAIMSFIVENPALTMLVEPESIAAILYLGIVVTALGFVLWFTGVQRMGAGTAGLCAGLAPPAAAVIGMFFGAPPPSPGVWGGMAIIGLGLVVGFLPSAP
ncbi:DMT family transporter [Gordonia sp. ABSL11-1]|uniref:DMT family transporter n=1 Tax=Gordonia sp. ABSL11-1 TaxID=3053924 RepID=UPI002573DE0C|nr:DMT family transporter [Gordonia sp. ABSL11-1]MDL9947657.1 DMT family transporter [Gordonia sp. ABSL11-1]